LRQLSFLTAILVCSCGDAVEHEPSFVLNRQALLDPGTCASCHPQHHDEWAISSHAHAADTPLFVAMNQRAQREANVGDFCVSCHAPIAVREGLTRDGLNLADLPRAAKGVTCYFCHSVDAVEGTHNNPLRLANDGTMRGALADAKHNGIHRSSYSTLHDRNRLGSATLCGSCHDVRNGHGLDIERTFAEWQESAFSQAPGGTTCSQCHMRRSERRAPISTSSGVPPRYRHAHDFPALDVSSTREEDRQRQMSAIQSLLDSTLQSSLCVRGTGARSSLMVVLANAASGHGFPSGATHNRQAWVDLRAYRKDQLIYSSGVVQSGHGPTDSDDPDLWLLRGCTYDARGNSVTMLWDAVGLQSNQLPAQATFDPLDSRFYQTHVYRPYPLAGASLEQAPDRVTMQVRITSMSLEVVDSLIESNDLHPSFRTGIPIFDVGPLLEWTRQSATETFVEQGEPISCISHSGLNASAARVRDLDTPSCAAATLPSR